jgi:FkbH-like protein
MQATLTGGDFRTALRQAVAVEDARARLDRLARLADSPALGFVETLQLDRVLGSAPAAAVDGYVPVRLALLSSSTIDHLVPAIRVGGLRRGMLLSVFAGAYGQYRQELLDPASRLADFRPDVVLLSMTARQAIAGVPLQAGEEQAEQALHGVVSGLRDLWRAARERFGATVMQQSFLDVFEPIFGSHDRLMPAAPARLVNRLNDLLAAAARQDGALLLDVAQASARDGIDAWYDVARWLQGKMEIAPHAALRYGELVARLLAAQRGRSRKCLVLDLDNTLWGGVVGDVGVFGLVLGEGSARGEAHLALQRYAKALKERGVILAVCSKNDPAIAERAFAEHPEMLLKRSDIAAFVANWGDKAENIRAIASQLNIGLDSLVFVDDNPAERARVREALPMVAVPELPDDPARYARCIAEGGYFEAISFTEDDARRGEQYAANVERDALRAMAQNLDEYLRGLEMTVTYGQFSAVDLARVTQLISKTNQFNTTGRRHSADDVSRFAAEKENITLQFRLADRFGDNGLVSVMILRPVPGEASTLEIDTWVMSCRVFGRQLEDEAMNIAVAAAAARGVAALRADFVPTERNGVISGLYAKLGFRRVPTDSPKGAGRWLLEISDYAERPTFITRADQR